LIAQIASLRKIWLFAGKSENPTLRGILWPRENVLGADNQQERPVEVNLDRATDQVFVGMERRPVEIRQNDETETK
jgi:hypothetical protein